MPVSAGKICNFPFTSNNVLGTNPSAENFNSPLGRMLESGDVWCQVYLRVCVFLWRSSCSFRRGCGLDPHAKPVTGAKRNFSCDKAVCTLALPGLRDCTVKSRFVFQRRRALHSQLKFIWFANCLHVEKGERAISLHCNLKSHNYGFSSPAGELQAWQAPGLGLALAVTCNTGTKLHFVLKTIFAGFGVLI